MSRVVIIGMGKSGVAAKKFLEKRGESVLCFDENKEKSELSEQDLYTISCSKVILSPGIDPRKPSIAQFFKRSIPVIGELELGLQALHTPAIGITGTNGKTTTTMLVAHILTSSGISAQPVGNIGIPLTEVVEDMQSIAVIEMSSFQLETTYTKKLKAAAILNLTPDHADRYSSFYQYGLAKCRIGHLLNQGRLFIPPDLYEQYKNVLEGVDCSSAKEIEQIDELFSKYEIHDENAKAAFFLCQSYNISPEAFFSAYTTFKRPEHRIQFIKKIEGISFYDDSKGTNVASVMFALKQFKSPVVLIAGGRHKGEPYTEWAKFAQNPLKAIIAIGESKDLIKKDLEEDVPVLLCNSLEEAIAKARSQANEGESVLLSPGCSSFDMFDNYVHRGKVYQALVHALKDGS